MILHIIHTENRQKKWMFKQQPLLGKGRVAIIIRWLRYDQNKNTIPNGYKQLLQFKFGSTDTT